MKSTNWTNHRRLASRKGGVWKNESLSESFGSRWANKVKINAYYKKMKVFFHLACMSIRACERSWAVRISAHVGVRFPCSTAQSRTRPLRSIPLPAHLQFHPTPVKSLHARSNLKFLCMPNTCRFQPKPYTWDTPSEWRTWSGFVAWLLRKKSTSLLFCRGAAVAVWLDRAPDTRIFRRQCGCSNLFLLSTIFYFHFFTNNTT